MYECKSCNNILICIVCANVCHSGHEILYEKYMKRYCFCGGKRKAAEDSSHLWQLDGTKFKNKATRLWNSSDSWNIKSEGMMIYIENISNTKVLETADDGNVIEKDFVEGNPSQLWIQGKTNAEGYFTLKSSKSQKFLAATKGHLKIKDLKIKGSSKFLYFCQSTSFIRLSLVHRSKRG